MSWQPERGVSGVAVLALHGLALAALLGATVQRDALVTEMPLSVSLLPEAKPALREPAPSVPAPQLDSPARDLPPLPTIAIAPAPAATSLSTARLEPAAPAAAPAPPAIAETPVAPPAFDADYLANPAPSYPALSRRLNEQGRVLVRVLVTPEGRAGRVELARSSGHDRLDRSALEAVARWRFVPARRGGEAVAAPVLVPVDFVLKA